MMACHHSHARTTAGEVQALKSGPELAEARGWISDLKRRLNEVLRKDCYKKCCRKEGSYDCGTGNDGEYECKTEDEYHRCFKDCMNFGLKDRGKFKCTKNPLDYYIKKGKKYFKLQTFNSSGRILIN